MSQATNQPFQRDESLNEPGIIGARWWQKSLTEQPDAVSRRAALTALLVAGGTFAAIGVFTAAAVSTTGSGSSSDDYRTEPRGSLDMQKEYGWSFGAVGESLTFDGETLKPFDRAALAQLPDDLRPALRQNAPYFVPTLFQSPTALPRSVPSGDTGMTTPLKDALKPIFTPAMDKAYRRGRALALLWKGRDAGAVVIVDLPGPEAVAFAAGAAGVFDPVFLFDNWPHPRGVVPAHRTLAAAAYYQPLFAKKKALAGAPSLFVLDRARLVPYTDEATQFDNRHVARLPSAPQVKQLGAEHVLYVVPTSGDVVELDDLNDDFVLYARGGLDVKMVAADAFDPDPADNAPVQHPDDEDESSVPRYYYGGRSITHLWFWSDYPWVKIAPPRPLSSRPAGEPVEPAIARPGKSYVPRPRVTPFSSGAPIAGGARPKPPGFGSVPVVIAVATGVVLGAKLSRNGTWNRTSGWGGG
ncbi:Hypothetical protein A7982_02551 [Minicystis rosea]|nr:Hypothetical protein A7982_02551 [Minicystis rosea]